MSNLINDLLDLAKLENSAFDLKMERFNLIKIIENAFLILSFQAESKGIKLLLSIDQRWPFVFQNVVIDKRRILQILLNFLSNALKFTHRGGFVKINLSIVEE